MSKGISAKSGLVAPRGLVLRRGVAALVSVVLGLTMLGSITMSAEAGGGNGSQIPSVVGGYNNDSFAVMSDDTLWAWGNVQLGDMVSYTTSFLYNPTKIMGGVKAVAPGLSASFVIKQDGSLWGWGANFHGEVGDGTVLDRPSPMKIMDGITAVSVGYDHSLALKSDGSLWAWGDNSFGQLGDGTSTAQYRPIKIMDGITAIAAGDQYSLVIKSDGSLWAWGCNYQGELGDGTSTPSYLPVKIMDGVKAIASGVDGSFAIKSDNSLWAWGYNLYGHLGDGTTVDRHSPVKVMDGVIAVSATYHGLAIKADGSLWAWGWNRFGQLGDGTTTNRYRPVKIMDGVKAIGTGSAHSLVIKSDGNLWAWGSNGDGSVGDGTMTDRHNPVRIIDTTSPAFTQFTVVFDPDLGKVSPKYKVVKIGASLGTLPTPTRSGLTFAGWYSAESGGVKYTSATRLTPKTDVTIYAHWTGKKSTVTFNANGGSTPKTGSKVTTTKSVTMGKAYGALPKTTKKGYTFAGWFTSKSGGTQVTSTSIVASAKNITLYAHWNAKQFTVKLNPRSGAVSPSSITVTYGKKYVGLPKPTRAGYVFAGWWTKTSGGSRVTSSTVVKITANQTLYARWKRA